MNFTIASTVPGPHGRAAILTAGTPVSEASAAVLLCHGRGGSAEDMLGLRTELEAPEVAWLAPQASGSTWYPNSFLSPLATNQPYLDSALALFGAIGAALTDQGVPSKRQLLLGFSQGGCLALEFAGRHARRYGGVVGLSGGLIGPRGHVWSFTGSLASTPVFLGCDEDDPHIPEERVRESAGELSRIGGDVEMKIYSGLGHTIGRDELARVQRMLDRLQAS